MKRVLFIGNRDNVLKEIETFEELKCVSILVLQGSPLHRQMLGANLQYSLFSPRDKHCIVETVARSPFDILISNGCPFLFPVSEIRKPHQLFINIHPAYLPDMRGRHPANGALLNKRKFTGATMHYMDDIADTGNIVYQEKVEITHDLDLGLIYYITFDLESRVFYRGMQRIIEANYRYDGKSQTGPSSYYTRSKRDMFADFESLSSDEILTRVRAFGIKSQGVACTIHGKEYRIFDAEVVNNSYLLSKFMDFPAGALLLEYDDKLLLRTSDGIIKIKSYEVIEQIGDARRTKDQ